MASIAPTFMHVSRQRPFPRPPALVVAIILHVLLLLLVITVELKPAVDEPEEARPIEIAIVQLPEADTPEPERERETENRTEQPARPLPPNLQGGEIAERSVPPNAVLDLPRPSAEPEPVQQRQAEAAPPDPLPPQSMPSEAIAPQPAPRVTELAERDAEPRPRPEAAEPAERADQAERMEETAQPPAETQTQVAQAAPAQAQQREADRTPERETPPAAPEESSEQTPNGAVQVEIGPAAMRELAQAFAVPRPPSTIFSVQPDPPRQVAARPPPPTPRPAQPPAPRHTIVTTANGDVDVFRGRSLPRQVASAPQPRPTSAVRLPRGALAGADRPTQTLADYILQQAVPHWRFNYRDPRYGGFEFTGYVRLLADGTLAPPFHKNDPLDFYSMIHEYRRLLQPGSQDARRAMETFVIALRAAQPFQLPPGVSGYPRTVPIGFLLGDL